MSVVKKVGVISLKGLSLVLGLVGKVVSLVKSGVDSLVTKLSS